MTKLKNWKCIHCKQDSTQCDAWQNQPNERCTNTEGYQYMTVYKDIDRFLEIIRKAPINTLHTMQREINAQIEKRGLITTTQ